jgi:E3 ubiquitin-protein ligase UHRF1
MAIRAFKSGSLTASAAASKVFVRIDDKDRPDEAFTTDRAKRNGLANAASGRIMVNIPNDHFGPIPAEADPVNNRGVQVGDSWKDRLTCRQWGAHFPHVAGIAGQSNVGSQSVVLSGGYEDDKDGGNWFLYTGSGGRDLSGNKRTNKLQSFDQKFESMNKALLTSCLKGLPVRVVRSFKEKRSEYAPAEGVRYDGVYRIEKAWRKPGTQNFLMCRYLFVRCDNAPPPWETDDQSGPDKPNPELPEDALAEIKEVEQANKKAGSGQKEIIYAMKDNPWWDWNAEKGEWGWSRTPPISQKSGGGGSSSAANKRAKTTITQQALKEHTCNLCKNLCERPVMTECGHSFCMGCLEGKFKGMAYEVDTGAATGRSMRARKIPKPCPSCKSDIADWWNTVQVNLGMEAAIKKLKRDLEKEKKAENEDGGEDGGEEDGGEEEEEEEKAVPSQQEQKEQGQSATGNGGGPSSAAVHKKEDAQTTAKNELATEFPEYDSSLIEALLEQEDGAVADVRFALRKMRDQDEAEKKKKEKAERAATKKKAEEEADGDEEGGNKKAKVAE